jgi:hypothetical protein
MKLKIDISKFEYYFKTETRLSITGELTKKTAEKYFALGKFLDLRNFQNIINKCHNPEDLKIVLTEAFKKWNGEKQEWLNYTKTKITAPITSNNVLNYKLTNAFDEWFDIHKPKEQKQKSIVSYKWQSNPEKELPELHSLMINKYKLIASEVTYEQFKAVFTGQLIDEVKPIKWHQDNASELLYFIDRLEQSNNIVHNPKRADYQKLMLCFAKPDGSLFSANWKQIKQNININLSPDKQKAIDELVNNF